MQRIKFVEFFIPHKNPTKAQIREARSPFKNSQSSPHRYYLLTILFYLNVQLYEFVNCYLFTIRFAKGIIKNSYEIFVNCYFKIKQDLVLTSNFSYYLFIIFLLSMKIL